MLDMLITDEASRRVPKFGSIAAAMRAGLQRELSGTCLICQSIDVDEVCYDQSKMMYQIESYKFRINYVMCKI
jgi:hypothetical protein